MPMADREDDFKRDLDAIVEQLEHWTVRKREKVVSEQRELAELEAMLEQVRKAIASRT